VLVLFDAFAILRFDIMRHFLADNNPKSLLEVV